MSPPALASSLFNIEWRMTVNIRVPMKINSEKKHSVRYDAVADNAPVTSIYIMKTSLPSVGGIPQNIVVTIEKENN